MAAAMSDDPQPVTTVTDGVQRMSMNDNTASYVKMNHDQGKETMENMLKRNNAAINDLTACAKALKEIRRLSEDLKTISAIVQCEGLLPKLEAILTKCKDQQLQIEAAWILANVAASPCTLHTKMVVDLGVIPTLLSLVKAPSSVAELKHTCLDVLSNIAGDSAKYRDILFDAGCVNDIMTLYQQRNISDDNFTWMLRAFCSHIKPPPKWDHVKDIVPVMVRTAASTFSSDKSIGFAVAAIYDLCWSHEEEICKQLTKDGKVSEFVKLIEHKTMVVRQEMITVWAHLMTTKDDTFVELAIKHGLLNSLVKTLHSSIETRMVLMCIANITASEKQIQAAIDCKGLVQSVIMVADVKKDPKIQMEAVVVLLNICLYGDANQVKTLMFYGAAFVLHAYVNEFAHCLVPHPNVADSERALLRMKNLSIGIADQKEIL